MHLPKLTILQLSEEILPFLCIHVITHYSASGYALSIDADLFMTIIKGLDGLETRGATTQPFTQWLYTYYTVAILLIVLAVDLSMSQLV